MPFAVRLEVRASPQILLDERRLAGRVVVAEAHGPDGGAPLPVAHESDPAVRRPADKLVVGRPGDDRRLARAIERQKIDVAADRVLRRSIVVREKLAVWRDFRVATGVANRGSS